MKKWVLGLLILSIFLVSGCVKCISEGDKGNAFNGDKCCDDLNSISYCGAVNGQLAAVEDGSFVCAKCGDGVCGKGENYCNCIKDCSAPEEQPAGFEEIKCGAIGFFCDTLDGKETLYYCDDLNNDGFKERKLVDYCAEGYACTFEKVRDTNVCQNSEEFIEATRKVQFKTRYGIDYSNGVTFTDSQRNLECSAKDIAGTAAENEVVTAKDLIWIVCKL